MLLWPYLVGLIIGFFMGYAIATRAHGRGCASPAPSPEPEE
jgi:hypothetical protein